MRHQTRQPFSVTQALFQSQLGPVLRSCTCVSTGLQYLKEPHPLKATFDDWPSMVRKQLEVFEVGFKEERVHCKA